MNTLTLDRSHSNSTENLQDLLKTRLKVSIDSITNFCRRWNIVEFSLFGSVLREDFRPDSDVDVLVVFAPEYRLTFKAWLEMQEEIENLFGRKVDLTQKKLLKNPYSRAEILKTHRTLYASQQS